MPPLAERVVVAPLQIDELVTLVVKLNADTVCVAAVVQPPAEVTVRLTVKVPLVVYVCGGAARVEVGEPSPKFQRYGLDDKVPVELLTNDSVLEQGETDAIKAVFGAGYTFINVTELSLTLQELGSLTTSETV